MGPEDHTETRPQFLGAKTSINYAMSKCEERKQRCLKNLKEPIELETGERNVKIEGLFKNNKGEVGLEAY